MKAVMRIKNFHRLCPRSLKILKKRLTPTPQIPPPVITEYDVDQMLKEEREKVEAKQKRKEEKRAKKEALE